MIVLSSILRYASHDAFHALCNKVNTGGIPTITRTEYTTRSVGTRHDRSALGMTNYRPMYSHCPIKTHQNYFGNIFYEIN